MRGGRGTLTQSPSPPLKFYSSPTTSTAAPWIWPRRSRSRASLACLQGKGLHLGSDRHSRGKLQKLLAVGPGQVGHRADHPLPPEQVVGKRRDIAHVDAAADHDPAFGRGPQGRGDQGAHRCKNDGRVQFLRGPRRRSSRPTPPPAAGRTPGSRCLPAS